MFWSLLVSLGFAQDAGDPWEGTLDTPSAQITEDRTPFGIGGVRMSAIGDTSGLGVSQASVVGGDGGTTAWSVDTRYAWDRFSLGAHLPMVSYRTPNARDTGLGNLRLDFLVADDAVHPTVQYGLEAHLPTGRAWTWVNRADEVWPSTGINFVYQRLLLEGDTSVALRSTAGLHVSGGTQPFPSTFLQVGLAGVVDQRLSEMFGLVGEGAITYWDTSPFEVSGLLRADVAEGLRLRGGLTVPLASWIGWQPADVPAGARETTLLLEVNTGL